MTDAALQGAPPFRALGPDHLAALAVIGGACLVLLLLRDRLGETGRTLLTRILAVLVGLYIAQSYYAIWKAGWLTWSYALPLHLCNVLVLVVLVTLLRPSHAGAEIAYYWGAGGSVHALVTPDLARGFPTWDFFQFFLGHGLLMVALVHLVGVLRLYPRPGSARTAFLALLAYTGGVGTLDAIFGWNYGYLCAKPQGASLLDHLGPWPWYVLAGLTLGLLSFWALSLPWKAARED